MFWNTIIKLFPGTVDFFLVIKQLASYVVGRYLKYSNIFNIQIIGTVSDSNYVLKIFSACRKVTMKFMGVKCSFYRSRRKTR